MEHRTYRIGQRCAKFCFSSIFGAYSVKRIVGGVHRLHCLVNWNREGHLSVSLIGGFQLSVHIWPILLPKRLRLSLRRSGKAPSLLFGGSFFETYSWRCILTIRQQSALPLRGKYRRVCKGIPQVASLPIPLGCLRSKDQSWPSS